MIGVAASLDGVEAVAVPEQVGVDELLEAPLTDAPLVPPEQAAALYAEHYDYLIRLARMFSGRGVDYESAVHDAFIDVVYGQGVTQVENAKAYLGTVVFRKCASALRKTHTTTGGIYQARAVPYDEAFMPPSGIGTPEVVLDRAELTEALEVLQSSVLTERRRRILLLSFFGEMPDVEIAAEMGIATATVRAHRSQALAVLRAEMAKRYTDTDS